MSCVVSLDFSHPTMARVPNNALFSPLPHLDQLVLSLLVNLSPFSCLKTPHDSPQTDSEDFLLTLLGLLVAPLTIACRSHFCRSTVYW